MSKQRFILSLTSISYGGANIGDDFFFDLMVAASRFAFLQRIDYKSSLELDRNLVDFELAEGSKNIDIPLSILITEVDPVYNDSSGVVSKKLRIDPSQEIQSQKFTLKVKGDRKGDSGAIANLSLVFSVKQVDSVLVDPFEFMLSAGEQLRGGLLLPNTPTTGLITQLSPDNFADISGTEYAEQNLAQPLKCGEEVQLSGTFSSGLLTREISEYTAATLGKGSLVIDADKGRFRPGVWAKVKALADQFQPVEEECMGKVVKLRISPIRINLLQRRTASTSRSYKPSLVVDFQLEADYALSIGSHKHTKPDLRDAKSFNLVQGFNVREGSSLSLADTVTGTAVSHHSNKKSPQFVAAAVTAIRKAEQMAMEAAFSQAYRIDCPAAAEGAQADFSFSHLDLGSQSTKGGAVVSATVAIKMDFECTAWRIPTTQQNPARQPKGGTKGKMAFKV